VGRLPRPRPGGAGLPQQRVRRSGPGQQQRDRQLLPAELRRQLPDDGQGEGQRRRGAPAVAWLKTRPRACWAARASSGTSPSSWSAATVGCSSATHPRGCRRSWRPTSRRRSGSRATLAPGHIAPWPPRIIGSSIQEPPMFEHIEPYAGDPIFAWSRPSMPTRGRTRSTCRSASTSTTQGRIPVLDSVRRPRRRSWPPAAPSPTCRWKATPPAAPRCRLLLFGADHPAIADGRVATIQTVGSSGGLKVGADFSSLAARRPGLGQRPDLGQPPRDVRGRGFR
jgi:hypothetical protein